MVLDKNGLPCFGSYFSENVFQQFLERINNNSNNKTKKRTKNEKKKAKNITTEPVVSFRSASLLGSDKVIYTREKWIKEMSKTMLFQEVCLGKSIKSIRIKRV